MTSETINERVTEFNALTLQQKFDSFGEEIFTAKQFNLIQATLKLKEKLTWSYAELKLQDLCEYMLVSERSIYSLVGHLKHWDFITFRKPYPFARYSGLKLNEKTLEEILESEFLKHVFKEYLAEQETEEVQDEEGEEVLNKEEQLKKGVKRLKESTIKAYSISQLRRHLDRLQNHFVDSPYRLEYGKVYKYEKKENVYYYYGETREAVIDAINETYKELGIL